ncbi:hypothetical protein PPYR_07468 [Photinus pyralis]|uniref:Polyprenal reductase n=1 Tax=Photinus pyralis TaxID=7054 RepID=A0A1Y1NKC1_PHOPY|nr:polyprenol reductase [Photinus pyralis]KAB0799588.1 hypothetical protein PPYR_07468 [Photinus pyralis]
MLDLNYVRIVFSLLTTCMILLGSLVNTFEKYIPVIFSQALRYGKFSHKGRPLFIVIEVPKAWFRHFYVYSFVLTTATLVFLSAVFVFKVEVPVFVYDVLDLVGGSFRLASISNTSAFVGMSLLTLQCCRRFYDTLFVSVFSKSGRMNIAQYLAGYFHYSGCILAILLETSKFVRNTSLGADLHWEDLGLKDAFAVVLFLWAWKHQYNVTVILANLRKNKKGNVVTEAHGLPHGDWFDYVSSPHILAELLMYIALTVILWGNVTWLYIFSWVLTNQVETALLTHWWYKDNFSNIPKNRKAIIPYIY